MMRVILLLFFVDSVVESCKWLDAVQEQIVHYELQNNGFHRDYVVKTKISSMNRFMDCELAYRIVVPKGAFVDTANSGICIDDDDFSLNSSLLKHCYNEGTVFNTEAPAYDETIPPTQPIYFYSTNGIRKLFIIEDELQFPLHIRYHYPSETEKKAEVKFQTPEVFITCKNNKTEIFADQNCKRFVRKIPCGCGKSQVKCEYMRFNVQPYSESKNVIQIPIGDLKQKKIVIIGTAIFVVGFIWWIGSELMRSQGKKKPD